MRKIVHIFAVITLLASSIFSPVIALADTVTPTPTPSSNQSVQDLQSKISDLEAKISDVQGQERTLSSQITNFDNQITLTGYKIEQTKQQILSVEEDIDTASKKITNLEGSLQGLMKVFVSRIVASYQTGSTDQFNILLTSNDADSFISRSNYLKIVQDHDKQLILDTYQAKNDYANQKSILEDQKAKILALQTQLQDYTKQLDGEKQAKQVLLAQTQGSEASYQNQLAAARAQLAGFSHFAASQGGASLLSNQTVCDGWGCYFSQRDTQWGNIIINNSNDCDGACTIAKVGCLITSISMVANHYGHKDITPPDIALSDPSNFAVGTAGLRFTINVKGATISRSSVSRSQMDSALQSGPLIVGISYDGGPVADHFVVITGGTLGNYLMNDPFQQNGHQISFTSKYPLNSIVEIDRVNI